jgi:hypothetical protein
MRKEEEEGEEGDEKEVGERKRSTGENKETTEEEEGEKEEEEAEQRSVKGVRFVICFFSSQLFIVSFPCHCLSSYLNSLSPFPLFLSFSHESLFPSFLLSFSILPFLALSLPLSLSLQCGVAIT